MASAKAAASPGRGEEHEVGLARGVVESSLGEGRFDLGTAGGGGLDPLGHPLGVSEGFSGGDLGEGGDGEGRLGSPDGGEGVGVADEVADSEPARP